MKIVVFGTGESCENYLKNYRNEHEIVALADWDEKKHGTILFGLPVISPYELKSFSYEKILIASYFVKEIESQLLERCGIDSSLLIIPEKYKVKDVVKPFEDENTKQFARKALNYFVNLFSKNEIPLFLEFGTLLGLVRDGDIISWDDDVDLSVNEEDVDRTIELLESSKATFPEYDKLDWTSFVKKDEAGRIWYISLNFQNKEAFLYKEFEVAFGVRKFYKEHSICMRGRYLACPEYHFRKTEIIQVNGKAYPAPMDYLGYLDLTYPGWRTPKEYTFGTEYGTISKNIGLELKRKLVNENLF